MARIKEFVATEKITPNDRGTTAFEQAGRRIGGFYEQIARAREQVGNDVGKLWNEVKFALDAEVDRQENLYKLARGTEQNSGGGERGGVRVAGGGKASDPFGLNGEGEFRDPRTPGNGNPNLPNEYNSPTVLRGRGGSEAANVGRAAEGLPSIIRKVILGQGLTDDERKIYEASGYGQKHTLGGYQLNTDPKKGGIAPNPDVSYDDAAKAGYNFDTLGQPGQPISTSYPVDNPSPYFTRDGRPGDYGGYNNPGSVDSDAGGGGDVFGGPLSNTGTDDIQFNDPLGGSGLPGASGTAIWNNINGLMGGGGGGGGGVEPGSDTGENNDILGDNSGGA